MAAGPEDLSDHEPFSPSDFLNLPATPSDDAAPQEDNDSLVLPYISRMLMEEDIDEEHSDHAALLRAQQPFADILAGAGSDSADAALADANWPYDPVELSQRLLCNPATTYAADTGEGQGPNALVGVGQDDSSSTAMENRVDMEMLNQAFLKGMEEASKFLPMDSNLIAIMANKEKADEVSSSSTLQLQAAGRCRRKNREHAVTSWDGDEMGRSSKLMMAAEEGSEAVDEFIQNGYQSLLDRMMNMSIDDGGSKEAEKKKSRSDEAVDLRTLLVHCAQAVASATSGGAAAGELLRKLRRRSSPRGDATQRLAHCFALGLEARLAGTGSLAYESLMATRASAVDALKAYQLYLSVCCFHMMAFKFSNMTICNAIRNGNSSRKKKKAVHIVDYGGGPAHLHYYGFQWPTLLGHLGTWEGGPPEVRVTAVGLPQPGFRPAARVDDTGRRLADFARRCGVPFRFRSVVAARWETVGAGDLGLEPDEEVVVVNGLFHFGRLMDEAVDGGGLDGPSPRDMVLRAIADMRPDVFVMCVENSAYHAPFFLPRFREALFYYSAMFDMMDAVAPRDSQERLTLEQELLGRGAMNVIACEGPHRVERPEGYRQWQARNERAGLRQLPLEPEVVKAITDKVKNCYHKDFVVDVDHHWLLQGWKGRILYAMTTWVPADA